MRAVVWLNHGGEYSISAKIQAFPMAQRRLDRWKAAEWPHIVFRCAAIQGIFTAQNHQEKPGGSGSENAKNAPLAMGEDSHGEGSIIFFYFQKENPTLGFSF